MSVKSFYIVIFMGFFILAVVFWKQLFEVYDVSDLMLKIYTFKFFVCQKMSETDRVAEFVFIWRSW